MKLANTLTLLSIAFFALCPATALAQDDEPSGGFALPALISSTLFPLIGLSVVGISTTGGVITTGGMASQKSAAKMALYLKQNGPTVAQGLNGLGQGVDDLASLFGVSAKHKPTFAKILRTNRKALLALSDVKTLNQKRTRAFISLIVRSMYNTPEFKHMIKVI